MESTPAKPVDAASPDPGRIIVRDSIIHGRGVFAACFIATGTEIAEYTGDRITKQESLERCMDGNVYVFTLDDQFDLDGNVERNPMRYANHSCAPNCEAVVDEEDRIWIVAIRDIQPGEEITYNYGYDLEDYPDHPCRCGAPNCIGFIVAEELMPIVRERLARSSPDHPSAPSCHPESAATAASTSFSS